MGAERDGELTMALARDLAGGFEALVHAYQHRLYAFALAMSGEPADAEEIAQDAFLRAHVALRRYPPDRIRGLRLSAWLHQIALNVFRNRVRRRRLRVVPLETEQSIPDSAPGPERQALSRAALRELANLVSGLPEHHRAAVVLRCVRARGTRVPLPEPLPQRNVGVAGKQLTRPGRPGPTRCVRVPFHPSWCRQAWPTEVKRARGTRVPLPEPLPQRNVGVAEGQLIRPGKAGPTRCAWVLFIPSGTPPSAQCVGGRETTHTARETRAHALRPGSFPPLRGAGWLSEVS